MLKHLRHSSRIPIALRRSLAQQPSNAHKIMPSPWHRPELVPWVEDCWVLFLSLEKDVTQLAQDCLWPAAGAALPSL